MNHHWTSQQGKVHDPRVGAAARTKGPERWMRMALLPGPVILLSMAVLWKADLRTSYESPYLMMALNFVFSTIISLLIVYLLSRSFLIRSVPGLLLLICGVVAWAFAGVVAVAGGILGAAGGEDFANTTVTIHNICVWLSALCQLAGAVLLFKPKPVIHMAGLWLAAAYAMVLSVVGLTALLVLAGWMPRFFVQGQGGTPLRWFVLSSAVAMFAVTGAILWGSNRQSVSSFSYWYTLALGLIAIGLVGVMFEPSHGCPLSWVGRGAQFLSGAYMLAAAIASVREARVWGMPLETALRQSEERYRSLFEGMTEGFALHEIVTDEKGAPCDYRFLEVNPAFERLTGLNRGNVVGRLVSEVLTENEPLWVQRYGEVALTGQSVRFENYSTPLKKHYEVFAYRPAQRQFAVLFTDITERKRAEEALRGSEQQFSAIHNKVPFAIVLTKLPEGTTVSVNDAFLRLFEYTREEVIGKTSLDLGISDADSRDRFAAELQERGSVRDFECTRITKSGALRVLMINLDSVSIGGEKLLLTTILDITERKRAEEGLRESEAKYRLLFHNMLDGLAFCRMIFDNRHRPIDFTYLDVNDAFFRLTGLKDVVGKKVTEVIPGLRESNPELFEIYGRVASTGQPEKFEIWLEPLGIWFSVSVYSPQQDHFVAVFDNITERKRADEALRNSELLYRAIGESIDYGVWVCDFAGRNTYASESFLKLVGMTQEECSNFGWGSVLHPDDAERTIEAWKECVRTEGTWDIEHRYRGVDGQWHPILARGVPVRNEKGEIIYWAGINLDISRLKQTEAALHEREAALREADRRKNEFLAVLSHELRNPLAPIRSGLYILDRAAPGGEQAERAKAVIDRQVDQLARLVDDLLDVTRITRGKIHIQRKRFELAELLRRTVEDHRSEFTNASVELEVRLAQKPLVVNADAARVAQAIGNLLQNATKFTGKGGHVALVLEEDVARRMAVIRVRDTGIGIGPDMLPQLFQPFTQADSTLDRSRGGLGLGLALVKGLVDLHGGSVNAHSDGIGKGTEFAIRLPLEQEVTVSESVASESPKCPARRVLIIEDNVDAADTLRAALELGEHTVEVAYDGPDGINKARVFKPEVVLCDIGLPGMAGYDVAKHFRADQTLRSVFLVAVTGYALPEDLAKAQEAGFNQHLAKPISLEKLEQVLTSVP